ncbi:hypothetical protein ACHAW5_001257 [Stephanodiscus triporus]|uniref:Nuclear pore complex protein Nup153 n=1 Tax=Stephanodiscus triporus TaxID=2934178 RepID=A0ABD3QNP3_9STRA
MSARDDDATSDSNMAEALDMLPFATLEGRRGGSGERRRDDVVACCAPTPAVASFANPPPGIAFRASGGGRGGGKGGGEDDGRVIVVVEAVRLSPPPDVTMKTGVQGEENEGKDEDNGGCVGGMMKVVGSLSLGEEEGRGGAAVSRLACSDDARMLLVARTDGRLTCLDAYLMDASSSASNLSTPPNLWPPLKDGEIDDGAFVTCATIRPPSKGGGTSSSSDASATMTIAFGTNRGSLGVFSTSMSGGKVRGGGHVFHTAMLPLRSSKILLVGCNVANEVAVLFQKDDRDWDVLELMEGSQMSCPSNDEDEFLFLMGLAVVMVPLINEPALSHPFPLLASSDGSLTGFVPRHRSAGAMFFARRQSIVSLTPDMGVPVPISLREFPPATEESDDAAFMSNISAPSFSFGGTSTDSTPTKPAPALFGFDKTGSSSRTMFGSAFGVTATTFGAASPQNPSLASAPVFGSQGISGPVFGSSTTSKIGFGALAASSGQSLGFGFGPRVDNEKNEETMDSASSMQKASTPTPVFGSGVAPVFGSRSTQNLGFASLGAEAFTPDLGTKPCTNVFGAFGGTNSSHIAPSMLKPVFDVANLSEDTNGEETQNTEGLEHCVTKEDKNLIDLIQTSSGKKAMEVFNKILTSSGNTGSHLPISKFESLVEEVGEGFHGDELDKQLAIVDHDSTGEISKGAFVKWYCNLVDQEGDDSSQGSDIAEEKAKAEEAFDALGKGSTQIPVSDLSKLFESMGTTYCEEEHIRTIKKISSQDESGEKVITRKAFLDWYVDWLFGDGDSDEDGSVGGSAEEQDSNEKIIMKTSDSKTEGWGSTFKTSEEGSWKCGTCMVTNKQSAIKCAACETPKPGEEANSLEASLIKPVVSGGGIGASGFTFGSAMPSATSSTAGGGVFGASSIGSGGFSFGGFASKPAENDAKICPGSENVSFGGTGIKLASTGIGSGGFTFSGAAAKPIEKHSDGTKLNNDQDDRGLNELLLSSSGKKAMEVFNKILTSSGNTGSHLPISKFESLVEEVGEGFHGDELDKQLAIVDHDSTGEISKGAFVKWYCNLVDQEGDDSSQGSDIAEEKAKAEEAFDALGKGSTQIPVSDLSKLFESMGTTYCEEEHIRTIKKISSQDESGEKVITRKAFLDWYVDWLFGDGDSDEDGSVGGSAEEQDSNEKIIMKTSDSKTEGWGSTFKTSEEGSWKCGTCMVTNKQSAIKCAACETPKPGEEANSLEASLIKPVVSGGGIGASGFTFGSAMPSATSSTAGGGVFGASSIGSGGFSFGGFASKPAENDAKICPGSENVSFGGTGIKLASTGIGSGGFTFSGAAAKPIEKHSDGTKLNNDQDDRGLNELLLSSSGKKAMEVFNKILTSSGNTGSHLPISKFESLVEEVGEGFHGDELDKQLAIVDHDSTGEISKGAFVKWYCNLVDQEGDDSSQGSDIAEEKAKAEEAFDALGKGSTQIPVSDLSKLFESMGTTYCEEEHIRTIKKISSQDESGEKVITRKAFLDWYVDWLFGDGDSDEDGSVGGSAEEQDSNEKIIMKTSDSKTEGWGSTFKTSEEGSWKCGTCMVTNKQSAIKCAACETPKPGEEANSLEASLIKPVVSGGGIGASGFTFGSAMPSATSSTAGGGLFGASSIGSGGFSLGGFASKPAENDAKICPDPGSLAIKPASGNAFPPMSAIAPTPFSAFSKKEDVKDSEKSSSNANAAFPPMSTAAPKNPFSDKPASGGAFPPMSATAPTPFSAFSKKEDVKDSEKARAMPHFPPMSTAAPKNPFSARACVWRILEEGGCERFREKLEQCRIPSHVYSRRLKNPFSEKPASGGAFPPMSATAPTPFSAFSKKEDVKDSEKSSSNANAAFPPMSTAAPKNPFSAKPASGGAFPPMSATAPTPFSAFSKKEDVKDSEKSSSNAFPPMSTAAPKNPFSAKPASGSAFPSMSATALAIQRILEEGGCERFREKLEQCQHSLPCLLRRPRKSVFRPSLHLVVLSLPMSATAPTPFSAFWKKEDVKDSEKSSSNAAFPPMSTAAPKNPFSAKPASGGAFPPMSATAPTPFSAFSKKEDVKDSEKSSSNAAFPPMSTAAPKNPFSAKPASGGAFPPISATGSSTFDSFIKKEEVCKETNSTSATLFSGFGSASNESPNNALKRDMLTTSTSADKSDFGGLLRNGAKILTEEQKQPVQMFCVSSKYEAELWDQVNRFSEKTANAKRLQKEASSCIPSDLESGIEHMVKLYQEKISNAELLNDQNTAIQKRLIHLVSIQDDLDRQKKLSLRAIEEQTTEHTASNLVRKEPLDAESEKMRRTIVSKCHKVQNLMSMIEIRISLNKAIFSCSTDHRQDTLRPCDYFNQWSRTPPISREQTARGATNALFKTLTSGYDRVRDFASFVQYISEKATTLSASHESTRSGPRQSGSKRTPIKTQLGSSLNSRISPLSTRHLVSPMISRRNPSDMRSSILERQKSLRQMTRELSRELSDGCSTSKIFYMRRQIISRNSCNSQARIPDWRSKGKNQLFSNSKSEQMTIIPKALAASPAVAKTLFSSPIAGTKARNDWNTTSEREKAILNVNVPKKLMTIEYADAAKQALAKFGMTPEKLAEGRDIISRDAAESNAPLNSEKTSLPSLAPRLGGSNSNVAAFPSMSTRSPTLLSQSLHQKVSSAPTPTTLTTPTGHAVDYKGALTKFFEAYSPEKIPEVQNFLQKYQGREAEMFVSLAKKYNKPNALNEAFESRLKDIDKNDYLALTTLYLQVFNPTRAHGAGKLLTNYKGKEEAMFAEYSSKWYTCNPLEKVKPVAPATVASASAQNLFALSSGNLSNSVPAPAPLATEVIDSVASEPVATGTLKNDYHELLTEFYQKHNPQKVSEIAKTLENYKVRTKSLFRQYSLIRLPHLLPSSFAK